MNREADRFANEILTLSRNKLLVNLRFLDVALSYHNRVAYEGIATNHFMIVRTYHRKDKSFMKKGLLFLICTLFITIIFCSFGFEKVQADEGDTEELNTVYESTVDASTMGGESKTVEETGSWVIDEYVDDFGDGIGIKYAKSITEGTFTNSVTTGSSLSVITFFDPELEEFSFRLLENNKSKATYYEGDLLRILFKFDDEIEEHLLQGSSTSGDLCLSVYKEVEAAQALSDSLQNAPDPEKAYLKVGKELVFLMIQLRHTPEKSSGYYKLYNCLADGNDARCVIYIESSKYSFTISADGFSDALSVLHEDKYKEAEQLLSEKKYDEAIEAYEKLNGYNDSAEKILKAKYEKAGSLIDEGKYEEAQELFSSLDDYADSAIMVKKCKDLIKNEKYEAALDYLKNNKFDDAIREFSALKDYKDSEERLKEGKYKKALDKMDKKDYSGAKKIFESIGDYSDASDKAEECESLDKEAKNEIKYKKAEKALESEDYDTAKELFSELGGYKDSEDRVQECLDGKYQEAIALKEDGKYEEAITAFEEIGNYKDCKEQIKKCEDLIKKAEESKKEQEYNNAIKLLDDEYSIGKARSALDKMGDYKDCLSIIAEIDREVEVLTELEACYPLDEPKHVYNQVYPDRAKEILDEFYKENEGGRIYYKITFNAWNEYVSTYYPLCGDFIEINSSSIENNDWWGFDVDDKNTVYRLTQFINPKKPGTDKDFYGVMVEYENREGIQKYLPSYFDASYGETDFYFTSYIYCDYHLYLNERGNVVIEAYNKDRVIQTKELTKVDNPISVDETEQKSEQTVEEVNIVRVQTLLNESGFDCGAPDGKIGPMTSTAISNYQKANGLLETGTITEELLNSIGY